MADSYRRRLWRTSGLGWAAYWPLILSVVSQFPSQSWAQSRIPSRPIFAVGVTPRLVTLTAGGVNRFSAHLQNSSDPTVTWSLVPQSGTVDSNGLYTAPQSISAAQDVILTATSVTDPQKFATAKITLMPVTLSLNPGSAVLRAGGAMKFAAQEANATNGAVTWDVSPLLGTLTSDGLYTAPATITSQQSITIRATSISYPSASESAHR